MTSLDNLAQERAELEAKVRLLTSGDLCNEEHDTHEACATCMRDAIKIISTYQVREAKLTVIINELQQVMMQRFMQAENKAFHENLSESSGNLRMCQKCKGIGLEHKLHECVSQQEKEAIERANAAFREHLFRTNMLLLTSSYMKEQNLSGMGALKNPYVHGLPENNTGWPLFETKKEKE